MFSEVPLGFLVYIQNCILLNYISVISSIFIKQICSKVPIFYFNGPKRPPDNCYITFLFMEKSGLLYILRSQSWHTDSVHSWVLSYFCLAGFAIIPKWKLKSFLARNSPFLTRQTIQASSCLVRKEYMCNKLVQKSTNLYF